jgi:NAD(P)-dependent dehydrogenase (short-subunit alcohol dehydrogenase family)
MARQPLALVTGGGHRLGKAFASVLARDGYALLLHYWHSEEAANDTAAALRQAGVPVFVFQADLTDPISLQTLFSELDRLDHPLKVLVNSAGMMRAADPRQLAVEDWDATMNLNLRAPFLCAQAAAARMPAGGLIVNVADVGARKAWSGFPDYTVSKAGVEALTRVLARAFAPSIRVNCIAPGLVLRAPQTPPDVWERLIQRLPLKRSAALDEIGSALEFFVRNEYVTGQTLAVDGGYSLLG